MDQQQPIMCASRTKEYIGVFLAGVLIGAGALYLYVGEASMDAENTYQAGFDAARKIVEESSIGPMIQATADVRAVSGTITAINGDRIAVRIQSMDPFMDPALLDRTIIVAKDTSIVNLSPKDQEVMRAEMEKYMKSSQPGTPNLPPDPFTRVNASLSDLAVGGVINVTVTENIKAIKEFTAREIQILSNATVPSLLIPPVK